MKLRERLGKFFTLSKKGNGGFTLVELIVVIAILAVLAGVAVPVYSGYVKKADEAADNQLLAAVNRAFVSACLENGESNYDRNDVVATITDGQLVYTAPFKTEFDGFYEGGEFKGMTYLRYNGEKGCFEESSSQFSSLFNTLKEKYSDAIGEKILTTNLGAIKTEDLFEQLNGAMDMAGNLGLANMGGEAFVNAYFGYLGFDPSDYSSDEEAQAALNAKLEALGGVDDATASTNAIALYAAQNSSGLTVDRLNNWLGNGSDTDDLKASASANTLAEAGALYGMYLSYQQKTNGTVPEGNALEIMNDALSDEGFANWVSTSGDAQAELEAYKTYMSIVNEAGKDDNTRNEILANGFQNDELQTLVKDLIGK